LIVTRQNMNNNPIQSQENLEFKYISLTLSRLSCCSFFEYGPPRFDVIILLIAKIYDTLVY